MSEKVENCTGHDADKDSNSVKFNTSHLVNYWFVAVCCFIALEAGVILGLLMGT